MRARRFAFALVLDACCLVGAPLAMTALADVSTHVATDVARARARLPSALQKPMRVELDGLRAVEANAQHATLSVALGSAAELDETVWTHELVHVASAGARPTGPVGKRLMHAVDEAVADFAAATFTGSSRIGSPSLGELRELEAPPFVGDSEWAYLGIPSAPWDAHRLGWALAAELFQESPKSDLALDAVHALADPTPFTASDEPRAILAEWIRRCPPRSRYSLRRAVDRWAPAELLALESP